MTATPTPQSDLRIWLKTDCAFLDDHVLKLTTEFLRMGVATLDQLRTFYLKDTSVVDICCRNCGIPLIIPNQLHVTLKRFGRKPLQQLSVEEISKLFDKLYHRKPYGDLMLENEICGSDLAIVTTADDLELFGIESPVHRFRILRNIEEWRDAGVPLTLFQGEALEPPLSGAPVNVATNQQLTYTGDVLVTRAGGAITGMVADAPAINSSRDNYSTTNSTSHNNNTNNRTYHSSSSKNSSSSSSTSNRNHDESNTKSNGSSNSVGLRSELFLVDETSDGCSNAPADVGSSNDSGEEESEKNRTVQLSRRNIAYISAAAAAGGISTNRSQGVSSVSSVYAPKRRRLSIDGIAIPSAGESGSNCSPNVVFGGPEEANTVSADTELHRLSGTNRAAGAGEMKSSSVTSSGTEDEHHSGGTVASVGNHNYTRATMKGSKNVEEIIKEKCDAFKAVGASVSERSDSIHYFNLKMGHDFPIDLVFDAGVLDWGMEILKEKSEKNKALIMRCLILLCNIVIFFPKKHADRVIEMGAIETVLPLCFCSDYYWRFHSVAFLGNAAADPILKQRVLTQPLVETFVQVYQEERNWNEKCFVMKFTKAVSQLCSLSSVQHFDILVDCIPILRDIVDVYADNVKVISDTALAIMHLTHLDQYTQMDNLLEGFLEPFARFITAPSTKVTTLRDSLSVLSKFAWSCNLTQAMMIFRSCEHQLPDRLLELVLSTAAVNGDGMARKKCMKDILTENAAFDCIAHLCYCSNNGSRREAIISYFSESNDLLSIVSRSLLGVQGEQQQQPRYAEKNGQVSAEFIFAAQKFVVHVVLGSEERSFPQLVIKADLYPILFCILKEFAQRYQAQQANVSTISAASDPAAIATTTAATTATAAATDKNVVYFLHQVMKALSRLLQRWGASQSSAVMTLRDLQRSAELKFSTRYSAAKDWKIVKKLRGAVATSNSRNSSSNNIATNSDSNSSSDRNAVQTAARELIVAAKRQGLC